MSSFKVFAIKNYVPKNDSELALESGKIYTVSEIKNEMFLLNNDAGQAGWAPGAMLLMLETVNKTEEKKFCDFCEKEITDKFITDLDKEFHIDCFKCWNCKQSIGGKTYLKDGDKILCEDCYHQQNSPICAKCNERITSGGYLKALGKSWHKEHFVCEMCGKPHTDTYHNFEDKPYCSDCFPKVLNKKCSRCGENFAPGDEIVTVKEQQLHLGCLVCEFGGEKLDVDRPIKLYKEKLYCEDHFLNNIVKTCVVCQKKILRDHIATLGKDFHKECFKCEVCGQNLVEAEPKYHHEQLLCRKDFDAIQMAEKNIMKEEEEKKKREDEEKRRREEEEKRRREEEEKRRREEKEKRRKEDEEKRRKEDEEKRRGEDEEKKNKNELKRFYAFEELQNDKELPFLLNKSRKEEYLTEESFLAKFKMPLSEFKRLPLWKQKQLKTRLGLMY